MTCDKAAQIHAYLDDEMDAKRRGELEAHLLQCAECQRFLTEIRGLSSLIIRSSRPVPMRAGAMATYYGAWRSARDRAVMRITGWLTAAAAVLLIGALLLGPVGTSPSVAAKPKPGIWEVMVITPPVETHGEANSDLVQVAQWMADDLSSGGFSPGGRSR